MIARYQLKSERYNDKEDQQTLHKVPEEPSAVETDTPDTPRFDLQQATSIIVELDESVYSRAEYYSLAAHEVAHSLQYEGLVFVTPFLNRPDQGWKEQHAWFRKLSRFVYFDMNGLYFLSAYHLIEGGFDNSCYWQNFFEKEAEHYSRRRFVDCP